MPYRRRLEKLRYSSSQGGRRESVRELRKENESFKTIIGWVWMNHFDDEGTSDSYLCQLGWEAYGESEENVWFILVPTEDE